MAYYTNSNPLIISKQGNLPDCMIHSLVNAGVCTYKYAKYLNKKYLNIHKTYKKNIGMPVDKEFICKGIFVSTSFIDYALMELNISYRISTPKYVSQLPISSCGILIAQPNNSFHDDADHAVYKHKNYILDSTHSKKIQLKNYDLYKCTKFFKFI